MSDDIRTEARSLLDVLPSWGDGANWCDPSGQSIPIPKVTLRRLLNYILTDVEAILAERARLATDSGIKSELLEEIANGSTPPTRTSIQARHDEMWTEARKVVADPSPPLRPMADETNERK